MKFVRLLSVLLVLSLSVAAPTQAGASNQAHATHLFDIEIERTAQETKVHLKADGAITDYHEARLKKSVKENRPDRMYLDLKNLSPSGPIPAKEEVRTALARIRTGRRTGAFRVVFDSNLDELFDYTISEQPDGLLVTIQEPSAEPAVVAEMVPESEPETEPEEAVAPVVETIYPQPKAAGDLDLVIATSDLPEQAQEWLDSSADRKIGLQILKSAKPDQEINTSFLVTGVSPDRLGDFTVAISFTLLDPNGKVVRNKRHFAKTSGRAPVNPAFIMADPMLDIILAESDPAGEYTIIGIVEDLTNNKMVRTSRVITLEK